MTLAFLFSAFIKADLRRQKANKETPEIVSMWELGGNRIWVLGL